MPLDRAPKSAKEGYAQQLVVLLEQVDVVHELEVLEHELEHAAAINSSVRPA